MPALQSDWTAAGHSIELADRVAWIAGLIGAGILAVLLVRALARHRRYRAVGVLSADDERALREEIARAERATAGELAVVVLEQSDDHPQGTWLAALACVLAAAIFVSGSTLASHPALALAVLFASGAVGYFAARALPDLRRTFVRDARAEEMAEEQALQEFAALGLHRTAGRTGVLILVSLFERTVIVLADDGIHAAAGEGAWLDCDETILSGIDRGSLSAGLKAAIQQVGQLMAVHCPRSPTEVNELPDHLLVRRR